MDQTSVPEEENYSDNCSFLSLITYSVVLYCVFLFYPNSRGLFSVRANSMCTHGLSNRTGVGPVMRERERKSERGGERKDINYKCLCMHAI